MVRAGTIDRWLQALEARIPLPKTEEEIRREEDWRLTVRIIDELVEIRRSGNSRPWTKQESRAAYEEAERRVLDLESRFSPNPDNTATRIASNGLQPRS